MRVEVVLPLAIPGTLTYGVPVELIPRLGVGRRVVVPLGTRRTTGYLAAIDVPPPAGNPTLRDVLDVEDDRPGLPEELMRLVLEAGRH